MPQLIFALVLLVASALISSLMMKKNKPKPAKLDEFQIPQVEEGTPEAVLFGQCWTRGWQSLWYGDLKTKKIKSGGKK